MSGRTKRGPGRPRTSENVQSLSPYPNSPLTPDSEENFIMSIRDVGRSTRVRNRSKPQPAKKTRVNAQSKLKSPIKSSPIGSCTGRSRENHDISIEHGNLMDMSPYSVSLHGSGQLLFENLTSDGVSQKTTNLEDELSKSKVCSFCNCGVEMRMFHGKLQRYAPTPGFNPSKRLQSRHQRNSGCEPFRDKLDLDSPDTRPCIEEQREPQPIITRRGPGRPPGRGRRKGIVVVGLPLRSGNQELTIDKTTFGTVKEKDLSDVFEEDGYTWAHHCCAAWSEGVSQTDSYDLINVDKAVVNALSEQCNHCNRFGASVVCQIPRCGKTYHYPCAASSGSFQDIKSFTMLCPDHLEDAGHLAGSEAVCVLCGEAKDFGEQIFCTSCGSHYHGRCLEPSVDLTSLIRMGWQCPDCKVCQGCRQPGDDNRMLVCDLCDTGYHTYCLDPPMSTIPKTGWKCVSCRRCEDCGSNTPGGGPTSRWHHNFSVCDSCYQQRNKGLFCPLCGRAYRQFTDVAMVQCLSCEKWIHASCDDIDKEEYQKYNSKDLPYFCPSCKPKKGSLQLLDRNHGIELGFNDQPTDVDMSFDNNPEEDKRTLTIAAGCMSPCNMDDDLLLPSSLDDLNPLRHFDPELDVTDTETIPIPNLDNIEPEKVQLSEKLPLDEEMEVVVKPDHELDMLATPADLSDSCSLPSFSVVDRHLSEPKALTPSYYQRHSSFVTPPKLSGKRKLAGKVKSKAGGTPARKKSKHGKPGRPPSKLKTKAAPQTSPGKENVASALNNVDQTNKEEESESLHTTLVLFSADDEFTSRQDMCLCCGSFGKGSEGQLIMCSQCGQSYHPYCVGVKINKVILTKGWRCLDCTLCEGCGKGSDEARLLLCDSCDISYHTYCLDPPLVHVPQGGWKCKWCVNCSDCGATTPGLGCQWMSNYTQCGPCASKTTCPVCKIKYNTNDLMIQCAHCERWLHGSCDGLVNEEELDCAADHGYHCLYCRPKTKRALVGVSGPPSPRATALHHYRPQSSQDSNTSFPPGKPLHPCQRQNNNLVELKLSSHLNKTQMLQPFTGNNFELTEFGMRHMNRLKLPPGSRRRVIKNKVKPKRFGLPVSPVKKNSFTGHFQEKEAIFNRAFTEDGDTVMADEIHTFGHQPSKVSRPRPQSGLGRPGVGGFVLRGRGSGGRRIIGRGARGTIRRKGPGLSSMSGSGRQSHLNNQGNHMPQQSFTSGLNSPTKQPSFNSLEASLNHGSNERCADSGDENGLQDAYPKWMQEAFFGKDLLDTLGKDKRLKPGSKAVQIHSEAEQGTNQEPFPPRQGFLHHEQQGNSAQVPFPVVASEEQQQTLRPPGYQRTSSHSTVQKHHSSLGLSEHEIWPPSHALTLPEEVPNPDALYTSLDMLTDDLPPATHNDSHSGATRGLAQTTSQHLPSSATTQQHPSSAAVAAAAPTWNQAQPRPQGNDLDILDTGDILPHVDGQEVEEIFAGIEREMTSRVFNFLDTDINESVVASTQEQFPPSASNPAVPHHSVAGVQSVQHPMTAYGQSVTSHTYSNGSTHFQGLPGGSGYQQGAHNHIDSFSNSVVSSQLGFGQNSAFPRPGDLDDLPRERRRPPSPRVDPLKQQQKWEEDEKLGAMATISPVLYANLEHVNLKQEYPEWANRYRAIARLWRKLSVEQRDPYRLKARDNRVRLKDQGKKLIARNDDSSKAEAQKPAQNNPQRQQKLPSQEQQPLTPQLIQQSPQTQLPQQELPQTQQLEQQLQQTQPAQQVALMPQQLQQSQRLSQQMLQPEQQQQQPSSQPAQDPLQGHQYEHYVPVQTNIEGSLFPVSTVMPVPLTPTTPVRSTTPVTPGTPGAMTPTTPTTPTLPQGQVLSHSQIGRSLHSNAGNHPPGGKTVCSKGKKTKEEKEREKELRKQRLRIQQEQERQWKILQQRRALEQQRQQQQQQEENTLLRQELRKQQQAKGTKGTEEQKKKRLPKGSKRSPFQVSKGQRQSEDPPVSNPGLLGENSDRSLRGTQSMQQPVLPVGSSFSAAPIANANALASSATQFQNESSLDFLSHYDEQRNKPFKEGDSNARESNCRLDVSNSVADELRSVNADTSERYQGPLIWQQESIEDTEHNADGALWGHSQGHHQLEQPRRPSDHNPQSQEAARQNLWGCEKLQPGASQNHLSSNNSTGLIEQQVRTVQESSQEQEQVTCGNFSPHEQAGVQGDRQPSWLPRHSHPSGIPVTQSSVQGQHAGEDCKQIGQQPAIPDSIQCLPYPVQQEASLNSSEQHHQQQSVELQQPSQQIPVMHWQEELSQVRAQVAAAHDRHPIQSVPPHSAPPPPPPPPPLPASQQQQQQTGPLQPYEINTGWPQQQGQVPLPHVHPQPTTPYSQQPPQLHGAPNPQPAISQMPFQPVQQPAIQIAPNQLPTLSMTVQSQEHQLQQPQQDVAQRQQREQLIRAQQQQFFQMLQQQQVLQQPQQQQNTAIQPGLVRARFNQVTNAKDLPEIDTEEEHQERLRFLYRQRQAQKQQQMQMHAQLMQQAWIQQQLTNANGQGVVPPGMLTMETSSPQLMQQFAQQMHPQMSDLTQQQLLAEYQRRMQQRQELGKQTIQYDKVLQEFQQQQGIPVGAAHPGAPFIEVPQQRFALRQPTPVVQHGLKPINPYGIDGQFVGQQQQLYKMQLQQQMIMQQPSSELIQNNTTEASPSTGKVDALTSNVEVKDDSGESLKRSGSFVQSDPTNDSQDTLQSSEEDHFRQEGEKTERESAVQQDSLKGVNESTTERPPVVSSKEEAFETASHCRKDNLSDACSSGMDIGSTADSKEGIGGEEKETMNSLNTAVCGEGCDQRPPEVVISDDMKKVNQDVGHMDQTDIQESELVNNVSSEVSEDVVEKELSKASDNHPIDISFDASRVVDCKQRANTRNYSVEVNRSGNEAQTSTSDTQDMQKNKAEDGEDTTPLHHQDAKLASGAETIHNMNQIPTQAHHVTSQGLPVPSSQPQPQHFIVQHQFLAFQQQFLQMQQQRQVLVQQYQQLQQQLHQAGGQDPVLAAQVMTIQSQGQVLQQQMVQIWQQIQLIQHQLQLAGAPNQQQCSVNQQQPQAQQSGPQWPQGVIQGHQIAAQPSGFPVRPGVMAMQQHPMQARGALTDKVLDETPKQGRAGSKSKDTPLKPTSLGQPNSGMDWPPPKGKQTKPRQRKNKKGGPKVDPDLELQQQMLQQQLYQQMEQKHRLMQQKQGLYVQQGKQPGQQPSNSLNQHVVDNPGLLAQPSMDMPHPMRPLSQTPELPLGPPSRPDSQIGLPPGTPNPQLPLPPNVQFPPGHSQTTDQNSFSQRFPTPEDYLKQFGQHQMHQKQPMVQYVAEANNPFSDQFQGLGSKGRRRGAEKKKPGPRKPGKPRGRKAKESILLDVDPSQHQQMGSAVRELVSPWHAATPSPLSQNVKQEQSESVGAPQSPHVQINAGPAFPNESVTQENLEGSKEDKEQEIRPRQGILKEQYTDGTYSKGEPKKDINVAEESANDTRTPIKQESESPVKSKGGCKGSGLEALQKLESMVADMANEEVACKELEKQSELERLLDESEYDPEMDKIYETDLMEDTPFERTLLSPNKAVGNGSQANSVASLECHEESLISPFLEEPEKRKERQKFFADVTYSDTFSTEKKSTGETRGEVVAESEEHRKDETLMTRSVEPLPTPAPVTDTRADASEALDLGKNISDSIRDQCKQSVDEDIIASRGECSVQELRSLEEIVPQGYRVDTSNASELEQSNGTRESLSIGSTVADGFRRAESAILVPITSNVGSSVNELLSNINCKDQEIANNQQTPCEAPFGNTLSGDVCAAFPQQSVSDVASCTVPESVHECRNQIPNTMKYYAADLVQKPAEKVPARPVQREKPAKASKQSTRSKNHHSLSDGVSKKKTSTKEEDPLKKQLQELRRQEYERKKREYEEQQKKKRALQQQLRMEKQMIKEQRKRQRIYMNPASSRNKQKTEAADNALSLKISTPNNSIQEIKPGTPLSLCEPKLLFTHALTHPYGSRPFNGQCLLKGNFGSAKIDGIVDFYSQFPTSGVDVVLGHPPTPPSSLPPSPGVHQHKNDCNEKPLVNGDVSPEHPERSALLALNKTNGQDSERPSKRARYMAVLDSARGAVSVPPSMPTPPLSDSAASVNDRITETPSSGKQKPITNAESNGKESNSNSSSSSPETVQYIPSSSPESDALNRVQTPKFSALLHRDSTDSPTFPAVTIKREKVEHVAEYGSFSDSCGGISDTHFGQTSCCEPRAENDADELDNIHVSLTLSPISDQRVTDTVASVTALIGCSPPKRSDIVIEPTGNAGYLKPTSGTTQTTNKLSSSIAPMAHTSSDIYQKSPFSSSPQVNLSSSEEKCSRKRPEGPYCRHCDVLIIGIGMKRKPDDEETVQTPETVNSNETDKDSADYKIYRVNVEAGDCTGDIFCSEACLKQYFAHIVSECTSLPQDCKSSLNAALQTRMDMSVTSVGQTSVGSGNVTSVSLVDSRGGIVADGLSPTSLRKLRSPNWKEEERDDQGNDCKRQRRLRWKRWQQNETTKGDKQRLELTAEEIAQLLERHCALKPCSDLADDKRSCILCGETGDGDNNASARLLNLDVDVWVHLNCALWSLEVYETLNGALMNVDVAVKRGTITNCVVCLKRGATVSCNQKIGLSKIGCPNNFHFNCAIAHGCVFFKDKTMLCHEHRPEYPGMTDLILSSYTVYRKVYVNRDGIQQIASMLRHNQETNDKPQTLRVGSLVVKSLGQLLPHQLQSFHTRDSVYPVGFKTIRFYWSMHSVNRRCKYHCTVEDAEGIPSFTIRVEDEEQKEQLMFRGKSPRDAWRQILIPILKMRKEAGLVNLFPEYISGEDLFGLSEQFVLRIIESMPGVDQMQGYNMRYGPSAIMELPLAVNPTGSARSEPLLRTHFRSARARALRSATSSGSALSPAATVSSGITDESSGMYLKQFVYSKAAQYRKLKTEWKHNVFLGRSNIQGLGLFANKDMEGGSMVIEYIGSIIRNEVANRREQIYEKQNRGVYMFRIDSDAVIDATMAGGPARYINHSCSPNCVAEVVTFEKEQKIIIISNRKVEKGEELTYDYKFDFEDEENKIPCLCGAPNCRKWMN